MSDVPDWAKWIIVLIVLPTVTSAFAHFDNGLDDDQPDDEDLS